MEEMWKQVEGYEGIYMVSNFGRVLSTYPVRRAKSHFISGWSQNGYPMVTLYKGGHYKKVFVHVLVARHFIPNPLGLPEVNHKDSDRANARADNLEWVSRVQNALHARDKGFYSADTNPNRVKKLSKERCALLKHQLTLGRSKRELAVEFGVHYSYVCMVGRGERRA